MGAEMTQDGPPLLDLDPEMVDRPTWADVAVIEAMMVWPDDSGARDRWIAARRVAGLAQEIDRMPVELLRQFTKEAMAAPRLDDLRPEYEKRHAQGAIAGVVVWEATLLSQTNPDKAAVGKVQLDVSQRLKGMFQIEPRTMNNKAGPFHRFRAVSHLWAAYIHAGWHGDRTFPCSVPGLPHFLATAEEFRRLAERSKAARAPSTVMRAGEAVRLPSSVTARLPQLTEITLMPPTSPD